MGIPKVTVLVPIYNVEKYVSKCLDSLLNQEFKDFEVWAVIDGSPDNSAQIVRKYCKKDNRIKLIEKNNGGYGSVLQYGVKNIKSEYFLICDPDDWLEKNALKELYVFSKKNDLDIAVADRYNVFEGEKTYVQTFEDVPQIRPKKVYTDRTMIQRFAFGLVSPHAKLFKTDITKNIVFPRHVSYTDFVLYIISLANAKRVAYLNEALADYLFERPGNTKTDLRPEIINQYLKGWEAVLVQLKQLRIEEYPLLVLRLLKQLLFIMHEYKRVTKYSFDDKPWENIMRAMTKLQNYYYILKNNSGDLSIKQKIQAKLLLNTKYYSVLSRWLVKYKY